MRTVAVCLLVAWPATSARADLPPDENLVVQGIPAIHDALVAEAAPYTEARRAAPLAWNPQRRELLIATRFGDTPQVHSVAMPGGDRRQLTFFADRVVAALYPPDPHRADHFVFAKDSGGNEQIGRASCRERV